MLSDNRFTVTRELKLNDFGTPQFEKITKFLIFSRRACRHHTETVELAVGIISIGDLVQWIIRSQREAIQHLQGYISGQYPG